MYSALHPHATPTHLSPLTSHHQPPPPHPCSPAPPQPDAPKVCGTGTPDGIAPLDGNDAPNKSCEQLGKAEKEGEVEKPGLPAGTSAVNWGVNWMRRWGLFAGLVVVAMILMGALTGTSWVSLILMQLHSA